jgi:ribosome biogenesis protein UTP30
MIFAPFFRSIKIGKMSQTPAHILENLQTALPAVANAVKGGWDNIQNFTIKTNSSVSLPIWSCTLNLTDVRQTEDAEGWGGISEKEEEEEEEEEKNAAKEQASRKARKRVTNSDGEMERAEKPRKRSKK